MYNKVLVFRTGVSRNCNIDHCAERTLTAVIDLTKFTLALGLNSLFLYALNDCRIFDTLWFVVDISS